MKLDIGTPTEYNFELPKIRFELCKKWFPKKNKKRFIDIGCGNGANTVLFTKYFQKIIGVDINKDNIEQANKYKELVKLKNIQYRKSSGDKIFCKNSSFDFATCFEVLEHVKNEKLVLTEIYRLLSPGSVFCISVPNKWYLMETHGFNLPFSKFIPYNRIPFLSWFPKPFYDAFGKARIYTVTQIVQLLEEVGFNFLEAKYIRPPFDKVKNRVVKTLLKLLFSILPQWMGVSIFVTVAKPKCVPKAV